jgi:hypothetical protein
VDQGLSADQRYVCKDGDVLSFSCGFRSNLSFGIGNGHVASIRHFLYYMLLNFFAYLFDE